MAVQHWLVLPVLGQVILTIVVGVLTLRARIRAVTGGETTLRKIALNNAAWPDPVRQLGNNFDNQFQVPALFMAAVAFYLATGLSDAVAVVIAFVFLAARIAHSVEHVTSNNVVRRMMFFLASVAAMAALWAWFAIRFYVTG